MRIWHVRIRRMPQLRREIDEAAEAPSLCMIHFHVAITASEVMNSFLSYYLAVMF